jgi:hypothetical protein
VILNIRQLPIKGNRFFSAIEICNVQALTNDRSGVRVINRVHQIASLGSLVQDINDTSLLLIVRAVSSAAAAAALAILARVNLLDVFDADHFSVPHL